MTPHNGKSSTRTHRWYRITVQSTDGRQYVATGRLRGYVRVKGVKKVWAEGVGFDLLFDREDVVDMDPIR